MNHSVFRRIGIGITHLLLVFLLSEVAQVRGDDACEPSVAEPFLVVAHAGIDRWLEDLDVLTEMIGQPNYAKFVRGFLAGQNDLRGFDRKRPFGVFLVFQREDSDDARPTFFFPTTEIEELIKTVRFSDALRLKRNSNDGNLILVTDDRDHPVQIEHDFAFLQVDVDDESLARHFPDPSPITKEALRDHDLVALLRREGIPQQVFDKAYQDIARDAEKDLRPREGESDAEYQIRRDVTTEVFDLLTAALTEWQSLTAGMTFDGETREIALEIDVTTDESGKIDELLHDLARPSTRFASLINQSAPLTVATTFAVPQRIQLILQRLLGNVRGQVEKELTDADTEIQEAIHKLLHAFEETLSTGVVDAYGQLVPQADGHFVMTGGIVIGESDEVASALQVVLSLTAETEEIQDVDLNVANLHDVAVHRLSPTKLRRHDRRLYGEDATIYLAAGRGVLWLAIGDEQAIPVLESAIESVVTSIPGNEAVERESQPLLTVMIHLAQWKDFANSRQGKRAQRLASLLEEAFPDSTDDSATLAVEVTQEGLTLHADFEAGFSRMFGLAVARRIHRGDE